jgi:hypothetical protein
LWWLRLRAQGVVRWLCSLKWDLRRVFGRREWREGVITQEKCECYDESLLCGRWMDDMGDRENQLAPSRPPRPHSKLRRYASTLGLPI